MVRTQLVDQNAVDFLRHGSVEAAQARLQVTQGDPQALRCERASKRAVDIPRDEHEVGLDPLHDFDQLGGHVCKLHAHGTRMKLQHVIRSQLKLIEEHLRHRPVVVLPRVHQGELGARNGVHDLTEPRDLDEVGACANDDEKVHASEKCRWLPCYCVPKLRSSTL